MNDEDLRDYIRRLTLGQSCPRCGSDEVTFLISQGRRLGYDHVQMTCKRCSRVVEGERYEDPFVEPDEV